MERLIPVFDKMVTATLFIFVASSIFSITITQIAGGFGGIAWLWRTQLTNSWKDQRWPLSIPFGLFVLASLIAVADAYDVSYSYTPLKKLLEILIFFWVVNCVRENRLRDLLIILLIISATIAGLYGFYQAWQGGVTVEARVEGTMSVYMTFAGLLMIVGMLSLGRALFRRPIEIWLWIPIAIISICLLFTLTRQAWLGFLIGLAFLLFVWRKKFFSICLASVIVLILVFPNQGNNKIQELVSEKIDYPTHNLLEGFKWQLKYRLRRMISGEDETFLNRVALWKVGWEIFKDHPLTGCGFRCVDLINSQYHDPTGIVNRLRGMHSNFVQLAVDTGILGLSAWMGIWFYFFHLLCKQIKVTAGNSQERGIIFGSVAAILAFIVGGIFETNFYDSEVTMVLYFVMALPFTGSQNQIPQKTEISPQ